MAGGPRHVGAWDYAPTFVEAGLDVDWLETVDSSIDGLRAMRARSVACQGAVGWLKYTIDAELMMNQIAGSEQTHFGPAGRHQAIPQMDCAPYQSANLR